MYTVHVVLPPEKLQNQKPPRRACACVTISLDVGSSHCNFIQLHDARTERWLVLVHCVHIRYCAISLDLLYNMAKRSELSMLGA